MAASSNGHSEADDPLMQRLIGLVSRVNDALRDFSEEQQRCSVLLERVERVLEKNHEVTVEIKHHVAEARGDIEEVRRDQTDPRMRLPGWPPEVQPSKSDKDSGGALAIRDGKVKFALPASWAGTLLKFGMSAGFGTAALRFIQWLTTGH
jgi:hypothetical protein